MLNIEQGNRLEGLAERLLHRLGASGGDPLARRVIVVPNPGTGRWLVQRMAREQGIAANLDLPLPASFFWRVLRAWLPDETASPFDRSTLVWRILAALPELLEAGDLDQLEHYLEDDDQALRRFQLAERIADVFDQYLVFRPEMVLDWEAGREDHWQARLWRAVTAEENAHRARLLNRLLAAMEKEPAVQAELPDPLFFFGINALPPVYLEILRRLGRHRDLHLYHLNPCREYWADIRDRRGLAHHQDPQAAFLELGNPLLASMGHVGQVFLDQLLSLEAEERDSFEAPGGAGVLARVQTDILELRDGREQPVPLPDEAWPSIQFHGTHTRLREVQVLQDNLLRCFEELEGLTPGDILVMAPDMAAYAPFVEAVFGSAAEARKIPFSIGDRSAGGQSPLGEAVRWLLKLPGCRFTAGEVLALLEVDAVQRRFQLDEEALERLRAWVRESGIRWGLDGVHRQELGLPPDDGLHSWRFGLKRLFLGFVTPVDGQPRVLADGTVPWPDIEGGELPWAGALEELVERLEQWRRRLDGARTLPKWREELSQLLEGFFLARDDEELSVLLALGQRLDELVRQGAQAGFSGEVSLEVMARLLEQALDDTSAARGFLQGGVTFSNLLPMRALPYRVVCLLGMNDSDFPRRRKPPSFDLMAQYPLRSDRDARRDDRYLFLESLVSARDCLIVSWQNRDVRSDQERLPAEVVSELRDYLDGRFLAEEGKAGERLFTQHRLQPFSPSYFRGKGSKLFSYDEAWVLEIGPREGQPLLVESLPLEAPPEVVELDDLLAFFRNPARVFLRRRLAMRFPADAELPEDREPFQLDSLEEWQIGDRLMREWIEGRDLDSTLRLLRGEGRLPHGIPGEITREKLLHKVEALAERLAPLLEERPWQEPLELDIPLGRQRLVGRVERHTGQGVLDYRVGKLRGEYRLGLWIRHLAVAIQSGKSGESRFVAEDAVLRLSPVERQSAEAWLADLLELHRLGLEKPLPFFPRTAWKYVHEGHKGEKRWKEQWEGDEYRNWPGEGKDPAFALAFRDQEPLDDTFQELARRIYAPLVEHMEETE